MNSATDLALSEENIDKRTRLTSAFGLTFWRIVSMFAILHVVAFDLLILFAPELTQVQFTPDDGYYYLALARNFIRFGEWTFDGGVSLTSGFHLMQAYLLAGVYRLFQPGPEAFVRYGLGISALTTLLVTLLAWRICLRTKDVFFLILFTLLVTAKSFLFNSVSVTEWPFVILIASLYCAHFYNESQTGRSILVPFILGLLGSLARSDFGLLPLSMFIAALIVVRPIRKSATLPGAFAGLTGAAIGVGIIFFHNLLTTGSFLQSSALMKSLWAPFITQKFYGAATLGLQIMGMDLDIPNFSDSIFLLLVFMVSGPVILILMALKSGQNQLPPSVFRLDPHRPVRERILVTAAVLCLAGYTILYTASGVIQSWYTANLTWPVFILLVAGARYLDRRILMEQQFMVIWLSFFTLVSLGVHFLGLYPLGDRSSPWPYQQFMLEAGRYLAQNPEYAPVGAWNSGIPGYYRGGTGVINIDGLVNNDIYSYVVRNDLQSYLRTQEIRYILDYENMFHPPFTRRGGYEDAEFLKQLTPILQFDQGQYYEFKFLRLYRLEP